MNALQTILRNRKFHSIVMLLALAWLTVSLPFVYAGQQSQHSVCTPCDAPPADEDNPLTNTTEEKTSTNTLSEYLHDTHMADHPASLVVKSYKYHAAELYVAFHPEAICPPPDRPGC